MDQLQEHALQISFINHIEHDGIVSDYLKECRHNKIILFIKREAAYLIVDQWLLRHKGITLTTAKEAEKIRKRISIVSSDELSSFIRAHDRIGFEHAVSKLYEL